MPTDVDLSRIARRRDQVLEAQFAPMPECPPQLLRIPGMLELYTNLKLTRERDIQTFQNIINNLGIATSTP